ncbi:hypothetical protein ACFL3X_01630 [Gemmatimonadota bacterium]
MNELLLVAIVLIPLAIYLHAGLTVHGSHDNPHVFFNAYRSITAAEFAGSSVAYNFQVASITFFIAFGFLIPIASIINAVLWAVGILLLKLALPHLKEHFGSKDTLFSFLRRRYNSPLLQTIAAVVAMLGFIGLLLAELVWGSQIFAAFTADPSVVYFTTFALGIFILGYFMRGGHVSVVRTDQFQLLFSFIGFAAAFGWLFLSDFLQKTDVASAAIFVISLTLALLYIAVVASIYRLEKQEPTPGKLSLPKLLIYSVSIASIGFIVLTVINLSHIPSINQIGGLFGTSSVDFSTISLISLLTLPIFWQFVDFSVWQRLGAVSPPESGTEEMHYNRIRRGINRYALESPVTILIASLFGIGCRLAATPFDEGTIWGALFTIPSIMLAGGFWQILAASLFAIAIVAVLLSTADSSLVAASAIYIYDANPRTRNDLKADEIEEGIRSRLISAGIVIAGIIIGVGLVLYFVLRTLNVDIVAILFGAFGIQLALVPATVGAVFLRARLPSRFWAVLSVLIGFAAGISAMIHSYSNIEWQYLPPLAAISVAFIIYLVGMITQKIRST